MEPTPPDIAGEVLIVRGLGISTVFPSLFVHGRLQAIDDTARRHLRPIGRSMNEVAGRTDDLLRHLEVPGAHIFRGVRCTRRAGPPEPRIAHVAVSGRTLLLIESVVWPPGRYVVTESGQIVCDGIRTGQSVVQLAAAVRRWRTWLPTGYRVNGLVVVHSERIADLMLPQGPADVSWTSTDDVLPVVRCLLGGPSIARPRALTVLWLATRGAFRAASL